MDKFTDSCKSCSGTGIVLIGLGDTEPCRACHGVRPIGNVRSNALQEHSDRLYAEQVKAREDRDGVHN